MSLQDGPYKLSTEFRNSRLHVGVSPDSVSSINEGGVPVVAGPESSEVRIQNRNPTTLSPGLDSMESISPSQYFTAHWNPQKLCGR